MKGFWLASLQFVILSFAVCSCFLLSAFFNSLQFVLLNQQNFLVTASTRYLIQYQKSIHLIKVVLALNINSSRHLHTVYSSMEKPAHASTKIHCFIYKSCSLNGQTLHILEVHSQHPDSHPVHSPILEGASLLPST